MSNGVGVLANALQSYLARKHAGGMLEAQQANQAQRDATAQEWQGREWQRSAINREEDMARALEQQAWNRSWQQQQAAEGRADKEAERSLEASREAARMAFQREQLEAQKAYQAEHLKTQKEIAQGHDTTRKQTAPRPGAGRGGGSGARKDETPYKVWAKEMDALTRLHRDASSGAAKEAFTPEQKAYQAEQRDLAEKLRQKIEALKFVMPQPDAAQVPSTPLPTPGSQPPPQAAPPTSGKKRAL